MVSNAGDKGARHKDRRSRKITIYDLMSAQEESEAAIFEALRRNPEYLFLQEWGFRLGELADDPRTFDILTRLHRIWPRLSAGDRELYLRTADRIAEAEIAKITWNPKAGAKRYVKLAKSALSAARLVRELSLIFPPPWAEEEAVIGDLVFELASFISGTVAATLPWDRDRAVDSATDLLRTAKKRIVRKAGRMHWELIRDLVWLASRKKIAPDERTVRRYLAEQKRAKTPANACWKGNWELIGNAFGLAKSWRAQHPKADDEGPDWVALGPSLRSEPFELAARRYLSTPIFSDTSPRNPAQK